MKLLQKIKSFFYERKGLCQSMLCSECDYYSFDDEKPCAWLNQLENKQRKDCPYRHENGNCLPIGGFCLSVSDKDCKHLREVENGTVDN